jgi:hypothetical protein
MYLFSINHITKGETNKDLVLLVVPKLYYFFFREGGRYEKTSHLVDIVFIIFHFFEQLCKWQDTKHAGD